jgi:GDP-L-fucose synthase
MVGSAVVRQLHANGYSSLVTRNHEQLELRDQAAVRSLFQSEPIDVVIIAAARVGGIYANNTYPAQFIYDNLMIECNLIHEAYNAGVSRLLFLGSSCIYPKHADQPMAEDSLLSGILEPTNEPYAVAKIAGIKLCESYNRQYGSDYRSVMPTNLYGPKDNYHDSNSHVIPGLIRRFHEAKVSGAPHVNVWGSGNVRREFLHVDDMAAASLHILGLSRDAYREHTNEMLSHVNIGTGEDVTIRELAEIVREVVGYKGTLQFDLSKPDGTPRKLLDVGLAQRLGWTAKIGLREGLKSTYADYVNVYLTTGSE